MQPATTLTIASVGASMRRVGDVGDADVAGAWMVVARMAAILAAARTAPTRPDDPGVPMLRYLISEIPWSA